MTKLKAAVVCLTGKIRTLQVLYMDGFSACTRHGNKHNVLCTQMDTHTPRIDCW